MSKQLSKASQRAAIIDLYNDALQDNCEHEFIHKFHPSKNLMEAGYYLHSVCENCGKVHQQWTDYKK